MLLVGIWILSTVFDRYWLAADHRIPSWDQAEYLSSALEHGRRLGILQPGEWRGWGSLLDLSPKIPPLASIISGSVMALAGEQADQASWVLSLWHGLLLIVVAHWARMLGGPSLGLLSAVVVALSPALAEHRVEFSLDLPLASSCTLALWLLYRWQRPSPDGGRWSQALAASLAIAASLLVKQSALLVVALPAVWSGVQSISKKQRRWQALAGLVVVFTMLMPWLHHNWITTLGGTERAVVVSGAEEGDPGWSDLSSLIWYPRLWPRQLNPILVVGALSGLCLSCLKQRWRSNPLQHLRGSLAKGWVWLIGVTVAGWLFTSLSPNKDPRYIAPVLALLSIVVAQGWLLLFRGIERQWGSRGEWLSILACLCAAGSFTAHERWQNRHEQPGSPALEVINQVRTKASDHETTLLLAASERDLNEQTLSYLGQINGGRIQARRVGRIPGESSIAREQAQWWVLVSGDQGTSRKSARKLSREVRLDPRFEKVNQWKWTKGRHIELWKRRSDALPPQQFDAQFIKMARGMEAGPAGLKPIFDGIGLWHLLDPQFSYQRRVQNWAERELEINPQDRDALWSLALLGILQNRLDQAAKNFGSIQSLDGPNGWAGAYQAVSLIADWQTCNGATAAQKELEQSLPPQISQHDRTNVLVALRDLGSTLCLDPRGLTSLPRTLPKAIASVKQALERPTNEPRLPGIQ
jgi:4-amino-4-deoxy-L-arabinose transferase-like glycosyltransferase